MSSSLVPKSDDIQIRASRAEEMGLEFPMSHTRDSDDGSQVRTESVLFVQSVGCVSSCVRLFHHCGQLRIPVHTMATIKTNGTGTTLRYSGIGVTHPKRKRHDLSLAGNGQICIDNERTSLGTGDLLFFMPLLCAIRCHLMF